MAWYRAATAFRRLRRKSMPDSEQIELPIDSASEKRSRSTPLKPTIWMTGVLVWATVIAFFLHVPTWVGIFLCLLTGLSFLLYLGSYIFLMATDREALRAERHSVKRLPSSQQSLRVQIPGERLERDQNLLTGLEAPQDRGHGGKIEKDPARTTNWGRSDPLQRLTLRRSPPLTPQPKAIARARPWSAVTLRAADAGSLRSGAASSASSCSSTPSTATGSCRFWWCGRIQGVAVSAG